MEVVPGLHWVDGIWDTKVYVLAEESRLVVIDAAMPGRANAVWRYLESLGYPPGAVQERTTSEGADPMRAARSVTAAGGVVSAAGGTALATLERGDSLGTSSLTFTAK